MLPNVVGSVVSAALGVGVAYLNYCISKYMLLKCQDKFAFSTVIRTLVCVIFLALVFVIGELTPCNTTLLLVCAGLGATLPTLFFTKKLLSYSKFISEKNSKKKEDNLNG
jgi:EamA domain-containing membrane protein RarD